jgi:hypothetical protein
MMEFTTSATRLQRPMARMSSWRGVLTIADSVTGSLYHKRAAAWRESRDFAPDFAQARTAEAAVSTGFWRVETYTREA